jgi:hypothetical protein
VPHVLAHSTTARQSRSQPSYVPFPNGCRLDVIQSHITIYRPCSFNFKPFENHKNIWQKEAYMGASIERAMKSDDLYGSGTLGCFIGPPNATGEERVIGLTNFHVVMSPQDLHGNEPLKAQPEKGQRWIAQDTTIPECDLNQLHTPKSREVDELTDCLRLGPPQSFCLASCAEL